MVRLRAPEAVRDRAAGERVLAWLEVDESWLVATDRALLLPTAATAQLPDGATREPATGATPGLAAGATPERVPWDLVLRVTWDERWVEITAQEIAGGPAVVHRVAYAGDAGALPGVVRERVNASIVVLRHVELRGEQGARLVARRTPGESDLRWSVVFDPGLDPRDPDLRRRADAALDVLRTSLGV